MSYVHRLFCRTLMMLVLSACLTNAGYTQTLTRYLLLNADTGQWCAYDNKQAWRSDVERLGAPATAIVEFSGQLPKTIIVSEESETGDWIIYDDYLIGKTGNVEYLKRKINFLSGDISEEQVYVIAHRIASKQKISRRSLRTGKVIAFDDVWLPDLPIITHLGEFDFAALIDKSRIRAPHKSADCVPARQPGQP